MEELKKLLEQGDIAIEKIRQDQKQLVTNFVETKYGYKTGKILAVNNMQVVVVKISFTNTRDLILKVRRLKHNNALEGLLFDIKVKPKIEIVGTYTGKI